MLYIIKILLIFTIFNLYCAEYPIPKEVLANIAEFMPANSKFVNYMARISMLSTEKYREIANILIFGEPFKPKIKITDNNDTINEIYKKVKIFYDYSDIDSLLRKYFNTTPLKISKIDNSFLQAKIKQKLIEILNAFPAIAFKAQLGKLNASKINSVIKRDLKYILFIRDSINITGAIDVHSQSNDELKLMKQNIHMIEIPYLIMCSKVLEDLDNNVKILLLMHANKINVIARIALLISFLAFYGYLAYDLFNFAPIIAILCFIVPSYIIAKDVIRYFISNKPDMTYTDLQNIENLFKELSFNLPNNFSIFMRKYRERIPVSQHEIIEIAKACIIDPKKEPEYINSLIDGLSEENQNEILQQLHNTINTLKSAQF